ncbi:hypothetical protein VKT23_006141 [Stygiomarasmius scandens]|uniref:Nephrocystin 3-like N-terminal domain-containing protein n=1 Tax=Marasmiellus scandens TaxID=2682957 RepID=A0ABR1JS82_9AGAR
MSFFSGSTNPQVNNSHMHNVEGNQINNITNVARNQVLNTGAGPVYGIPRERITAAALYNSAENESASTCLPNTRGDVMGEIETWARDGSHIICWVYGPAGSGKSTVARTVVEEYKDRAFTFFFSRDSAECTIAKNFFPTIAAQLPTSIGQQVQEALSSDALILEKALKVQLEKLILAPISNCAQSLTSSPILIIVDGLDECQPESCKLLLQALATFQDHSIPIRFLLFSRAESHIQKVLQNMCFFLDLWKFPADHAISCFFKKSFSQIYKEKYHLMEDVKQPWPSTQNLETLVEKAEGLFIYASTLVKFVDEEDQLPDEKLEIALTRHKGLDSLYRQVLQQALGNKSRDVFVKIMGTLLVLRSILSLTVLADFLSMRVGRIRLELQGCSSILMIPGSNKDAIQFYHASLPEFFTDKKCSDTFYIDPGECHIIIIDKCITIMEQFFRRGFHGYGGIHSAEEYACRNWYHHMGSVIGMRKGEIEQEISMRWAQLLEMITDPGSFAMWYDCRERIDDLMKIALDIKVCSH